MRILVWGAGAIGGTIGAYAIRAGKDVTFVDADREHVRAINDHGLRIEGPIDAFVARAPAFTPAEVVGAWSTILLCVKAHHTDAALDGLLPHLAPDGYIASLQNGLNEREIAQRAGLHRTVGAFINFGADVLEPGRIHFGGRGAVVVGELEGGRTERLERLHALLRLFDDGAVMTDNIWGYLWGKMGYGVMLVAGALTDESIADTLEAPDARPVMTELAKEVLRVAAKEGVAPMGFNGFDPAALGPDGDPGAVDTSFAVMVAHNRRSAKTHSGVWRDLAVRKRKTEIDAQFGPILELAAKHAVAVPHLERLVRIMREIEEGRRERAWNNLTDLTPGRRRSAPTVGRA